MPRRMPPIMPWPADTVSVMGAKRYVALLRGINVGGRNPVAMADLREAFETGGYSAVSTYIQSGNVLFESDGRLVGG